MDPYQTSKVVGKGSPLIWVMAALRRIDDRSIATPHRASRQVGLVDVRSREDVYHALSRRQEIIGDDPPVATPPNGFRAHDRAPVL